MVMVTKAVDSNSWTLMTQSTNKICFKSRTLLPRDCIYSIANHVIISILYFQII